MAMANLNQASQDFKPTLAQLDVTVKKYGKVADDADAFINGDGLAQLSDLIGEVRRLVGSLDQFSDQLNRQPTKLLFGDRRKGYEPKRKRPMHQTALFPRRRICARPVGLRRQSAGAPPDAGPIYMVRTEIRSPNPPAAKK